MTSVALTNVAAFDVEELDAETMLHVEGGCWWCAVIVATFIAQFDSFLDGLSDGYNAAAS
jgi:hypothetical protein